MKYSLLIALSLLSISTGAQTYNDSIAAHRRQYKNEFITEETRIELVELVKSMQILKTLNKDTVVSFLCK